MVAALLLLTLLTVPPEEAGPSGKVLWRAVEAYVGQRVPWERERVVLREITLPPGTMLAEEGVRYEVSSGPETPLVGRTPLLIAAKGKGGERRFWVTATIQVWTDVVVATRPLKGQAVLAAEDLSVERRDLAELPKGYVGRPEQAVGKRLRRALPANVPLRTEWLEEPPAIKRGDRVVILAESPGLRVSAVGESREDGSVGKRVKVVNIASQRAVVGRVVDGKTVKVEF